MRSVRDRLEAVRQRIQAAELRTGVAVGSVQLVAVTKYSSMQTVQELYELGVRQLGESRAQQLAERAAALADDISWHMIGSLQTNKINKVIPQVGLIHSLDSPGLAHAIDKRAEVLQRKVPVLLEVKTSEEPSKGGCPLQQAAEVYAQIAACRQLHIRGLMTMAPHTTDEKQVRRSFQALRRLFESLTDQGLAPEILSMGMSQDFEWAIEEGANLVRIGHALVGD